MLLQRGIDLGNPVADHPLNQGLVSWYLGLPGRAAGYKVPEIKSNGASGALSGTVTTPWTAGSGHGFQAVRLNNDRAFAIPVIVGNVSYTVAFRYLLTSTPSYSLVLESTLGPNARIGFDTGSSTRTFVRFVNAGAAYTLDFLGSRGLNNWNTVVLTRQVGAPCYWYCNGVRTTIVASGPSGSAQFNRVGGAYASGWGIRGAIESLSIFNYAMQDSQAMALTNQYDMGYPNLIRRTSRRFLLASDTGGGGGGFQPAWARGSNSILCAGS